MKKTICLLLALCMAFLLCSCNQQTQPTKGEETNDLSLHMMTGEKMLEEWMGEEMSVRVTWPQLKLSEEDANKYPALANTFQTLNQDASANAQNTFDELQDMVEEMVSYGREYLHFESDTNLYVQRADANLVSFLEYGYVYSGGAHPNHFYIGSNYDSKTGKELKLTDVLADVKVLPELLSEKLTEKYADTIFWEERVQTIFEEYEPTTYQWTIDNEGITFWFSPYELAAYVEGSFCAKIYFSEEPDLFCEPYATVSENYALQLPEWLLLDFDLTEGDGKTDYVEVFSQLDDYGIYSMFAATVNGENYVDEINSAYEFTTYLVHTGGQSYIYYDAYSDGDYHVICGIDVNGNLKQIAELPDTRLNSTYVEEGYEDGTRYQDFLNNPDHFTLATSFQLLGTRGGVADYRIDSDGSLQRKSDAYTFTYGHDVTSVIPLEMTDRDNQVIELPAGTVFTPVITDGATWVEFLTKDGKTVRATVDMSDWPYTLNGIPEEECFEMLFYAG